ncbi:salt tolerance-like protein [Musa troglodytarum]|uniref:Salt tolerance-like protein n=1 Tax=Musa troglodytarum TaxID=320322 RepID=A0A9E7EQ61_9LILI|nr:salt tolerance-like protein [Musa troglodytarum]
MKILCDFCGNGEALVFCCADEAALCDACDHHVHCANKLASKHRRFSIDPPSAHSHPLCDICREKRSLLFCREDRAILCHHCDASIHSANHLTMKHSRFLLTGIRLSASPISFPEAEITGGSASSISEYLIKMCPGWHVEDLLVDDGTADAMDGFSNVDELLPLLEEGLDGGGQQSIRAPHVPQFPSTLPPAGGTRHPHSLGGKEVRINLEQEVKDGRERWGIDAFMVPQISPATTPGKRSRHSVQHY